MDTTMQYHMATSMQYQECGHHYALTYWYHCNIKNIDTIKQYHVGTIM